MYREGEINLFFVKKDSMPCLALVQVKEFLLQLKDKIDSAVAAEYGVL